MKYRGYWSTNNGNTYNEVPIESSNWKNLQKTLRKIVFGNLAGKTDSGRWSITIPGKVFPEVCFKQGQVRKSK